MRETSPISHRAAWKLRYDDIAPFSSISTLPCGSTILHDRLRDVFFTMRPEILKAMIDDRISLSCITPKWDTALQDKPLFVCLVK